eukprot:3717346-Rhodomonas_salina.1
MKLCELARTPAQSSPCDSSARARLWQQHAANRVPRTFTVLVAPSRTLFLLWIGKFLWIGKCL